MNSSHWHRAFGLIWQGDIHLTLLHPLEQFVALPDVVVSHARRPLERMGGIAASNGVVYPNGVRLTGHDAAVLDMVDGNRIFYTPGKDWRGELPTNFYGSASALLLAWRGFLPLHASAVAVDGRVLLVAGESGAGKSTLVAGLCRAGATFFGDDLSVVLRDDEGKPCALPGRAAIRLYTDAAVWADMAEEGPPDARGKRLVRPAAVANAPAMPVSAVLLLEDGPAGPVPHLERLSLLSRHVFRPRWLTRLPGDAARRLDLLALSRITPVFRLAPVDARRGAAMHQAVQSALRIMQKMDGHEGCARSAVWESDTDVALQKTGALRQ